MDRCTATVAAAPPPRIGGFPTFVAATVSYRGGMRELDSPANHRQVVGDFLVAASSATAVLTVEGEPGIGKTSLCREAIRLARRAQYQVLECRPTSAEASLSFAGLTDLLSSVDDAMFEALPAPQCAAVRAAVLRVKPTSAATDERAIGTGVASMLGWLSARGPILISIDDTHWLDPPTHAALMFALRRLASMPIGLVVSSRPGTSAAGELAEAIRDPAWSRALVLRGLPDAELFRIVRDRLGLALSRPQLTRVADVSEGNPFVAVELARALVSSGDISATSLPVPESLQSLAAEKLAALSPASHVALLAVACTARPTLSLLTRLGLRSGLEQAEDVGIVELTRDRVEFTHPLLAAAAVDRASPSARRAMHERLSEVVHTPEEVARHRALAVPEPDDDVAAALDVAVDSAIARGAAIAALELAALALDRTQDTMSPAAWRRRVRLAERLHVSGSTAAAAQLLEGLADDCPPGPLRARGWLLLTEVAYQTTSADKAARHARAALADAVDDPVLSARARLSLAALSSDVVETTLHVAAARIVLDEGDVRDPELLAWVACEEVSARFHRGDGLDREALDRALALERGGREWTSADQVASVRPVLLKWADYPEAALAGLEELRDKATEEGNDGLLPYVDGHIPVVLLRLGWTADAAAAAAEHLVHAEAAGQESQRVQALYNMALVNAHLGELDEAGKAAGQTLEWGDREDDPWMQMSAEGLLGFIAVGRADMPAARGWFDRWAVRCAELGLRDPGVSRHHGDHVEALLATGAVEEAAARTEEFSERAHRAGRVSAAAVAARCRALLASATGQPDAALQHLDDAMLLHRRCLVPFDQARTLLTAGIVHRRAKHKLDARSSLVEAVSVFTAMDAAGWAARAQTELQRVAGRSGPTLELTATEQRVAELAASGLTNREVAERAFISPKTVESNLARAYRKLGISSRAELGAKMASATKESRTGSS